MRSINRDNYEAFFLDYLEGNLSDSELKNLEAFLVLYPDLKEELDEMCLFELEEEEQFADKTALKQIPFQADFDQFCVARMEGDLSASDAREFEQFLNQNQNKKEDYLLYEKTKLTVDLEIGYPDKESLKRKERKLIPYWLISGVGVAASVLILFTVWNTNSIHEKPTPVLSDATETVDSLHRINIETLQSKEIQTENTNRKVEKQVLAKQSDPVTNSTTEPKESKPMVSIPKIQRQSIPNISNTIQLQQIENKSIKTALQESQAEKVELAQAENGGLAKLGMSWKSSVPKKEKNNSLLYAVAKMGVQKLGEIAGKKIQFEKKYDSKTEKTKINFNTTGLGFSTSVK